MAFYYTALGLTYSRLAREISPAERKKFNHDGTKHTKDFTKRTQSLRDIFVRHVPSWLNFFVPACQMCLTGADTLITPRATPSQKS
jgi:hypothetical protein